MKNYSCLFLVLTIWGSCLGQTPEYQDKVKALMEINGSQETFKTAINTILEQLRTSNNEVPQELWQEMETEFKATSIDELVELLTPVYHRHLSEEDLDYIINFYQTPAGQKLAEKTPIITQESMMVGQQWGVGIANKVEQKLREQGY